MWKTIMILKVKRKHRQSYYLSNLPVLFHYEDIRRGGTFRGPQLCFESSNFCLKVLYQLLIRYNLYGTRIEEFVHWCYLNNKGQKFLTQSQLTILTMLTLAVFVTSFAQVAKNRVFLDCSTCVRAGLIVQMIAVLAFPPKESCKIRVSFESL